MRDIKKNIELVIRGSENSLVRRVERSGENN